MLERKFVLRLFEGFSIERWNDLIRPLPLVEMDKAAERAVLMFLLAKFEEAAGRKIEWEELIFSSLFDLLRKIALCDIKAPVIRVIRNDHPDEFNRLNQWVLKQYEPIAPDPEFMEDFAAYLLEPPAESGITMRISRAAHRYSSMREFELLKAVNEPRRLAAIESDLNADIEGFLDLRALQLLLAKQRLYDFLLMVESLRFQMRWNQTPRVPRTSVLGHSYFVAALTLLLSREAGARGKRLCNNFFAALFHDLPETVTRDIISPVKRATDALPDIVKDIEKRFLEKELVPLMDECFRDELLYFTEDEFSNRAIIDGKPRRVDFADLQEKYSADGFNPIDGRLIRAADHIAAFVEADSSIRFGISSPHLASGRRHILETYSRAKTVNGVDIHSLLKEFTEPEQLSLF